MQKKTCKKTILFILISIATLSCYSQENYLKTVDHTSYDINLSDEGDVSNAKFCTVIEKNKTTHYSPYEVSEYALKNGKKYKAKDIQLNDSTIKVFLQVITEGNIAFYYYKGEKKERFFVEKNGELKDFPEFDNTGKSVFRENLSTITSACSELTNVIKQSRYNQTSIKGVMKRYEICSSDPILYVRYGITAGYNFEKLRMTSNASNNLKFLNYKYEGAFSIGGFINIPISLTDFSFHVEAYYSKHSYSYSSSNAMGDIDYIANMHTLSVPLLFRYTLPLNKVCPYINAGLIYSYNFKWNNSLFNSTITDNTITIDKIDHPIIDSHQIGYNIGAGVEYKLNYKNSLFFDIRYSDNFTSSSSNYFNKSTIYFSTSINL